MSNSPESSATSVPIPAVKHQEKPSFTQKCSLLSRYLKENGSFGDLNIAMTSNAACSPSRPLTTMDLFPQHPCLSSSVADEDLTRPNKSAMTMFYDGKVFVFDDVSAAKAKEIMTLASNETAQIYTANPSIPTKIQDVGTAGSSTNRPETGNPIRVVQFMNPNSGNGSIPDKTLQNSPAPILWELPITRTASLYRFLEKRKDRIAARAPYRTSGDSKN